MALIAPGFQGGQRDLYIELFRVMCVTPVIFAASLVLGEILVAERSFVAYGLAPLMYNGGIVAGTVLLGPHLGVFGAAVGAVIGALAHLAIRVAGIWRTRFRPRPSLAFRTRGVAEFLRLMVPKMASHPVEPLTFLYFTALASTLTPGSVSSVSFARNFQSVPVSLIGASFAIAAFPALSAAAAAGDRRGFTRQFGTTLTTITVLTIVAGLGLFVVSGLAIRLLLGGGAFDDADIARTTGVLAVFAVSVPLESLTHILSRAIYATRNTIMPTAASIAGFVATVVSAQLLVPRIGIAAIPAGFAIGLGLKVVIMAVALVPRIAADRRSPVGQPADAPGPPGRDLAAAGIRAQARQGHRHRPGRRRSRCRRRLCDEPDAGERGHPRGRSARDTVGSPERTGGIASEPGRPGRGRLRTADLSGCQRGLVIRRQLGSDRQPDRLGAGCVLARADAGAVRDGPLPDGRLCRRAEGHLVRGGRDADLDEHHGCRRRHEPGDPGADLRPGPLDRPGSGWRGRA